MCSTKSADLWVIIWVLKQRLPDHYISICLFPLLIVETSIIPLTEYEYQLQHQRDKKEVLLNNTIMT